MKNHKIPRQIENFFKVMKRAFDCLDEQQRLADQRAIHAPTAKKVGKKDAARAKEKKLMEPMMRLFMTSVLGHVLECHEQVMTYEMIDSLRGHCEENIRASQIFEAEANQKDQFNKKVKDQMKRVHFNVRQLGKFLKKAASNDFSVSQHIVRQMGKDIKEQSLFDFVKKNLDVEDDTETNLTIDLYVSHYDMTERYVILNTIDLMHLGNAIWLNRLKVVSLEEKWVQCDRLYKLMEDIQPPLSLEFQNKTLTRKKMGKELTGEEKLEEEHEALFNRTWNQQTIDEVKDSSVPHNFLIVHRFLEFHRDLCFCRECETPIDRSIAPQQQRGRTDLRLIKVYRPREAPHSDLFNEFERLLTSEMINAIKAKEFMLMRFEFEEFQKVINVSLQAKPADKRSAADYEVIALMERGKKICDQMKNAMVPEQRFFDYVIEDINTRAAQVGYLQTVEKGLVTIKGAKADYEEQLWGMIDNLRRTTEASESAQIPAIFRMRAADSGVSLKFTKIAKLQRKEDKSSSSQGPGNLCASATFTLGWLRAKKVIARMEAPENHKCVYFTFNNMDGGDWEIDVIHKERSKTHMLFNFQISQQQLLSMQRSGKSAKLPFNNGFVVINAFNLLQLLARITAS